MRRWILYLLIICVAGMGKLTPFHGTDVAGLAPVALIRLTKENNAIIIETDTGDKGQGTDAQAALKNLKETTPGTIFLATADYLLLEPDCAEELKDLYDVIRPSCGICFCGNGINLPEAAAFLKTHRPNVSLHDLKTGERNIPVLKAEKGRMYLAGK